LRPGIRIRDLAEEFQELQPLHDKINITLFVFSIFVCYQVAEEIADRDLKMPCRPKEVARAYAVVATFISSQFLGTNLDIPCQCSLREPQFLTARSQTLAYRNISWVCHTGISI
jgi:hypothetical protein